MPYRKPRRLNSVTVVLLLMLAGGVYWFYVFGPAYWDAWTVDHELREAAALCYRINLQGEPSRTNELRKLLQKVQKDVAKKANITDPDLDVALDIDGDVLALKATYAVKIRHPVGNWVSTVHMTRVEKSNIKRVSWD